MGGVGYGNTNFHLKHNCIICSFVYFNYLFHQKRIIETLGETTKAVFQLKIKLTPFPVGPNFNL